MKKAVTVIMCLIAAICLWMYNLGRNEGIRYTIEDSCFFIVDYNDPDANAEGFDTWVYIELEDGNVYKSGMYIG